MNSVFEFTGNVRGIVISEYKYDSRTAVAKDTSIVFFPAHPSVRVSALVGNIDIDMDSYIMFH